MDADRIKALFMGDDRDPRTVIAELLAGAGEGVPVQRAAVDWTKERLQSAGVSADTHPVQAIKVIRQAEPRLDLKTARYLVHQVTASGRS